MEPVIDPAAWRALLATQDGVVSRRQALRAGLSSDAVRRLVHRRIWRQVYEGVYKTDLEPLTGRAKVHAALLAVGEPAVAATRTALWLAHRDPGPSPADVHVGVLDGRAVKRRAGIIVHHYPDLSDRRVLWSASPPRIRPEVATLDLVHRCRSADAIVATIARSRRDGVTSLEKLRTSLAARPRMHDRELVRDILADVAEGAQSPLERRDLLNDRAHGIVGGERQVTYRIGSKRQIVDVVFRGNGLRREVVKELDGRTWHEPIAAVFRDMRKDNASEERNQSHLRYGWADLADEPCAVALQTHRVLSMHGWRDGLVACSPQCLALRHIS